MKLIQVLGPGCSQCDRLAQNAAAAVRALAIEASIQRVTDIDVITSFNVLMTPALAVDGTVKVVGRVPSPAEIERWLDS